MGINSIKSHSGSREKKGLSGTQEIVLAVKKGLVVLGLFTSLTACGSGGGNDSGNTTPVIVDTIPPVMSTPSYSITTLTNQSVVVTITSAEDIQAPAGWDGVVVGNVYTFHKAYATNTTEAVQFKDVAGNGTIVNVVINNIDVVGPSLSAPVYSTISLTNQPVTATITATEDLTAPLGFVKAQNGVSFIYMKTYSANTTEAIVFNDEAGNSTTVNITVGNIDITGPNLSAPVYSTTALTNQAVVATITATEDLTTPAGWIKTQNGSNYNYKKAYSTNTTEAIVFSDVAGNITTANVTVNNIDVVGPILSAPVYSTTALTNQPVVVIISSSENLTAPTDLTKTGTGPYTYSKTYNANTTESFTFTDTAGNETTVNVTVNNIDTTAPITSVAPAVSGTTDTVTTLSATINESGTGYCLVQPIASTAPTMDTVIGGGNSFAMTANTLSSTTVSGLSPLTSYKIYFVSKDTVGNIQSAISSVVVTTIATPDTTTPIATGEAVSTAYNTPKNGIDVLSNDSDNSGVVTLGNITNQVGGVFIINAGKIDFTPTSGFSGMASATYQVKDPSNNISTAVVTVNVASADTTPDQFIFADQTGVALSTPTESAPITVAGINAPASISVNNGEYQINGGTWTSIAGTVQNGQTVKVRNTSSGANSTAVNTTLTIGGVSDIFTVTTLAATILTPTLTFSPDNDGTPDHDLLSVVQDATTITFQTQTPGSGGDGNAQVLVQVTNGGKLEVNGTQYTNGQYVTVSSKWYYLEGVFESQTGITGTNVSGTTRLLKSDGSEVWSKTFITN